MVSPTKDVSITPINIFPTKALPLPRSLCDLGLLMWLSLPLLSSPHHRLSFQPPVYLLWDTPPWQAFNRRRKVCGGGRIFHHHKS